MSVKIELDKKQLDEVAKSTIEALEKKVRSLESKVGRRDNKLRNIDRYMDLTKETRGRIRVLCVDLMDELADSNYTQEIEDYCD